MIVTVPLFIVLEEKNIWDYATKSAIGVEKSGRISSEMFHSDDSVTYAPSILSITITICSIHFT